jgi:2-succinyl-6-hydroxy-2,4-cyclohexadiene-1-carboxylate synthase
MWLLLHGFTGSPQSWSRVVSCAELDRTPLTPTLAGHGLDWQSRAVQSFDGEVTRLGSLASAVEPPRLLCGYSMGARVALGLLVRQPHLFDAALLIGLHPGLSDEAARAERRNADASRARQLRQNGLETFVAAWEELPLFASQRDLPREVSAEQRRFRLDHVAEGLARSLEALGLAEMPNYRASIASIGVPITLMTGALDRKFSEIARALDQENTHVDTEVVEGVGHNVVLEAPAAVAAAMHRVAQGVRG